jgi:hypothetical protein
MKRLQSWRSWLRVAPLAFLFSSQFWFDLPVQAQDGPTEYDLKAFVYQFLAYVTWPEGKAGQEPLVIGVVGANALANNLAALAADKDFTARPIEIRRLRSDADPRDLHVLFVAADRNDDSAALLRSAAQQAVLTITETQPRPADAMINFRIVDSKVRFEVGLGRVRASNMDISARLLGVALRVEELP